MRLGFKTDISQSPGGRPRIAQEVRDLIRRMSLENPLWGATKIHGELLKLGIAVAQSTTPRPPRLSETPAQQREMAPNQFPRSDLLLERPVVLSHELPDFPRDFFYSSLSLSLVRLSGAIGQLLFDSAWHPPTPTSKKRSGTAMSRSSSQANGHSCAA
jgi:hypothetical protein